MAMIHPAQKAASINPLKSSQPLGAAYAFLGVENSMPLFHGSQGCTSFALVLFVRHFKETIPLQTTAMDEVATILGGADHLEEALLNLKSRANPRLIGICTTALVETRGEDFAGDLALIKQRRSAELAGTEIVLASTPDFEGSIEEGWSRAVTAMIDSIVAPSLKKQIDPARINILAGSHLTVADIESLRDMVEAFGLKAVILPDISLALDGTVPDRWIPTSYGGTSIDDIREMGRAAYTIAIGEHMRGAARQLQEKCDAPFMVFETLCALKPMDRFIALLAEVSGRPVPARLRRRRSQLLDAMLDGHFHFGGKRIAIAAEPDLLFSLATLFAGLGAHIETAVTTTGHSPILEKVPANDVIVGDLMDLEDAAAQCDLLVTHSHGRQAAERLGVPLMRVGFPIFDRLGAQHKRTIGYEGIRDLIFEVANIFQSAQPAPTPDSLNPFNAGRENDECPAPARH